MIAENAIDWSTQWREEGRRKGEAEGRRKGEADFLLRLLGHLYSPLPQAVERRVRAADADQLLRWGERVVTSKSLDEIFGRQRDD